MADRNSETRDSAILKQLEATRKGRGEPHPHSLSVLSEPKVTPWGAVIKDGSEAPPESQPRVVTTAHNHFQNDEAGVTQGGYTVPDVSTAHNHFQNLPTTQKNDRLKLTTSKINDGSLALGHDGGSPSMRPGSSAAKTKMTTSRINDGNDIFGGPVSAMQSTRRTQPGGPSSLGLSADIDDSSVSRLPKGPIKSLSAFNGYTDASQKF